MTEPYFSSRPPENRRSERVGALVLSEIVYPAGFSIGWHSHELAAFALTIQGSSTEVFKNSRFERTESGIVVRPAGERHYDVIGKQGAKCFLIEFSSSWMSDLPQFGDALCRPHLHPRGRISDLAKRAYREWLENDSASKLSVQALALEIAAVLIREQAGPRKPPPTWLRQVRERLDDEFSSTPGLAELAAFAGVHPTYLARHFRHHHGMSVGEYIRQRRVDAAAELLAKSNMPLTEIALSTGFSHHAHFTAVFKRAMGVTPSEFRRLRH